MGDIEIHVLKFIPRLEEIELDTYHRVTNFLNCSVLPDFRLKENTMELRSDIAKIYEKTEDAALVLKEMATELLRRPDGDFLVAEELLLNKDGLLEEAKRRKAEREAKEIKK